MSEWLDYLEPVFQAYTGQQSGQTCDEDAQCQSGFGTDVRAIECICRRSEREGSSGIVCGRYEKQSVTFKRLEVEGLNMCVGRGRVA